MSPAWVLTDTKFSLLISDRDHKFDMIIFEKRRDVPALPNEDSHASSSRLGRRALKILLIPAFCTHPGRIFPNQTNMKSQNLGKKSQFLVKKKSFLASLELFTEIRFSTL